MAVAELKPFRRGANVWPPLMRGNIGAGGVSEFRPFRILGGPNIAWRGKNASGQIIIGWPFRRGNDLRARAYYYDGGIAGCVECAETKPATVTFTISGAGAGFDGTFVVPKSTVTSPFRYVYVATVGIVTMTVTLSCRDSSVTGPDWIVTFSSAHPSSGTQTQQRTGDLGPGCDNFYDTYRFFSNAITVVVSP